MEIRVPLEDYENLEYLLEKRKLSEDDINLIKLILQKVGVVLNIKEFIAIRYDDNIRIICPGMIISINVRVYEGSIALELKVDNSINFNTLYVEMFPEGKDELTEFIKKLKEGEG